MDRDAGAARPSPAPRRARALRRESLVLLPVSLLLFALIASVTLLSYRLAVDRLIAERHAWALKQAGALAERASRLRIGEWERLAASVPAGAAVALFAPRGALSWRHGTLPPAEGESEPAPPSAVEAASVEGPGGEAGERLIAWAPFAPLAADGAPVERWVLRLVVAEPALAAERRSLRILTPAVFGLCAAVAILAISFLYRLNRPFEELLERAREVAAPAPAGGPRAAAGEDELEFLFSTFDRALAALRATGGDDDPAARRRAEERLAESVAQLGELSAGVAHELRNSLGTLSGYLALIARRELPESAREELAEARREAAALGRVVDDFLDFARPGPGTLEAIDLAAVVEHALADPSLAAARFERRIERGPIRVRGNDRLLGRALRNLLRNAVDAQRAPGARDAGAAIDVELRRAGDRIRISIRDFGSGISPAIASRLFEPFASGHSAGAGLGLALARRVALLHGGALRLTNHPDGGAVAELELPSGDSDTVRNASPGTGS